MPLKLPEPCCTANLAVTLQFVVVCVVTLRTLRTWQLTAPILSGTTLFLLAHPSLSTLRSSLPVATSAKSFAEIQREQEEAMQRVSTSITQAQSSVSKQATSFLAFPLCSRPPSFPFHQSTAYRTSPSLHTAYVFITSYLSSTSPCPAASTTPPPTAHLTPPPPVTLPLLFPSLSLHSSFSPLHSQPSLIPWPG